MLFVLLLMILGILALSYMFTKDILSPSVLLSAVFCLACLFAIVGNITWGETVSGKVVVVISYGLFFILTGEIVGRWMIAKLRKKETMPLVRQGDLFEEIELKEDELNGKHSSAIPYSKWLMGVLAAFCLLEIVLYYFEILRLAKQVGYVAGQGSLLWYARNAMLQGYGHPMWQTIMIFMMRGIGFVCLGLFIHNVLNEKGLWNGIKKNWLLIFPIVTLLLYNVLSTSRNGFIMIVVIVFFLAFERIRSVKKINIFVIGCIGVIAVCLFLAVFLLLGKLRGQMEEYAVLDLLTMYAGSPIVALDKWLNADIVTQNAYFGAESFIGMHTFIERFFPSHISPPLFSENVMFANGTLTNIYTGFRAWMGDFGFIGGMSLCMFIGLLFGLFYGFSVKKKYSKGVVLLKIVYAYHLYALIYAFATPEFTTMLLSITHIFDMFFTCFVFYNIMLVPHQKRREE
ncbi:MAG: oligosaccharide repeat unit polymerase [Clostridia bacterium]|nr:oligosaccharide repeat unit polymerase [Clostridia bacterium]